MFFFHDIPLVQYTMKYEMYLWFTLNIIIYIYYIIIIIIIIIRIRQGLL